MINFQVTRKLARIKEEKQVCARAILLQRVGLSHSRRPLELQASRRPLELSLQQIRLIFSFHRNSSGLQVPFWSTHFNLVSWDSAHSAL